MAGMVGGGSGEAGGGGLVHKKREIRELNTEVALLTEAVDGLEQRREALRREAADTEEELRAQRQELHQTDIQLVNAEKDLLKAREDSQRIEERLALIGLEDDQLREERDSLDAEVGEAESRRQVREERKTALEHEFARLQEELVGKRRDIAAAREMVTALKVRGAQLREKKEAASRAMKRAEETIADLRQRIERQRLEGDECAREREALVAAQAASEADLRALLEHHGGAEAAYTERKQGFELLAAAVREEETLLKGLRTACDEANGTVSSHRLKLSEQTLELNHLVSALQDKYRLELQALLPRYADLAFDEDGAGQRQRELARLVDEMGEVNLTAIDEYHELEERFAFLSGQKADLEESLQSLQQAIQRINRTTRKRFLETFNLVNEKFQEVFPRLFCGGRAELKLTNEEDLLETGLDIIVQPPGKKLQNVTLLSGGEKALTAVALIFSIFLIKPSPFCLLDEVDAPLDDANIGRFNDMVREMSEVSQFIIITHNKATMAVADTLYGVTMEDPGVSKLVSVRLN